MATLWTNAGTEVVWQISFVNRAATPADRWQDLFETAEYQSDDRCGNR